MQKLTRFDHFRIHSPKKFQIFCTLSPVSWCATSLAPWIGEWKRSFLIVYIDDRVCKLDDFQVQTSGERGCRYTHWERIRLVSADKKPFRCAEYFIFLSNYMWFLFLSFFNIYLLAYHAEEKLDKIIKSIVIVSN